MIFASQKFGTSSMAYLLFLQLTLTVFIAATKLKGLANEAIQPVRSHAGLRLSMPVSDPD